MRFFRTNEIKIPTLYIMGEQDHLFLPAIKNIVSQHLQSSLLILKNCGHVVNIEQSEKFNTKSIEFINKQALN